MAIEFNDQRWYPATGVIRYTTNWVKVHTSISIIEYYSYLVEKHLHKKLNLPRHGAHVTVISGKWERVTGKEAWGKHEGKQVTFLYSSKVQDQGNYFWVEVWSLSLNQLREELGLGARYHPLHLTVGNIKNL